MKQCRFFLMLLPALFLLNGCTQTLYTHQQVLQQCQTKTDILQRFGQPDEINPGPGFDQWTYNMLNRTDWKNPKKLDPGSTLSDTLVKDSIQKADPLKYEKFVKFMIDKDGKILGYKAEGVDLTYKEKDSFGKNLGKITGLILVISLLVAVAMDKNSSNSD